MSNRVWDAEHGWHDGPAVDNAELVEAFMSHTYRIGYADGLAARWATQYAGDEKYTAGYADGHEERMWRAEENAR